MQTIQKRTEQELVSNVQNWLDRSFNFISLSNAEKVLDNMLFEHIDPVHDQSEDSAEDFIQAYSHIDEFTDSNCDNYLDFVLHNYETEFEDWIQEQNNEHYPMWNTLFEFRTTVTDEILNAAKKAGFGVIDKSDSYNHMLFSSGAGYSFFSAHWIPMYLNLPWVESEEYAHLDYSNL